MNEPNFNNEVMTAYLLGSLPETEAERFDELSFTDDEFAEGLKIAEKDLVDAYVNGELTNSTLKKFESYYLASPVRREKVEFAQAFQIFAEKSGVVQTAGIEEKISENDRPKRSFAEFFSALNIFSAPRPVLQWSFAAVALLFMALGGWLFFENSRLRNQVGETESRRLELEQREKQLQNEIAKQRSADSEKETELARVREEIARLEKEQEQNRLDEQERKRLAEQKQNQKRVEEQELANTRKPLPQPRQLNIASFILTPQLRGSNQLQTLSVPVQTDSVAMRLELESGDYAAYRVALRNPSDNRILWRSGKLKAKSGGENKRLNVRFPAALLKSQIYSLEVSGVAADGTIENISDYSFRVVR